MIEKVILDCLTTSAEESLAREIADKTKDLLKGLKKD